MNDEEFREVFNIGYSECLLVVIRRAEDLLQKDRGLKTLIKRLRTIQRQDYEALVKRECEERGISRKEFNEELERCRKAIIENRFGCSKLRLVPSLDPD